MARKTHRDHRFYVRVALPLLQELEAGAAEQRQHLAELARDVLLDWAASRLATRAEQELAAA
jgi:hypothetical protein